MISNFNTINITTITTNLLFKLYHSHLLISMYVLWCNVASLMGFCQTGFLQLLNRNIITVCPMVWKTENLGKSGILIGQEKV